MAVLGEVGVRLTAGITHRVRLITGNEHTGWALEANLVDQIRVGDGGRFTIGTDAEGHRLTRPRDKQLPDSEPAVILIGDSFVQGIAADDPETFGWILSQENSLRVVNMGVLGWGSDQELIGLADYLEAHSTQKVRDIVVFVSDNDFTDVQTGYQTYLGRSKPYCRLVDGKLESIEYRPTLSDRLMDVSYLYWLFNSKRAYLVGGPQHDAAAGIDLVVACVHAMRDLARQHGARFHLLAHHLKHLAPMAESDWARFLALSGARDINPVLLVPDGPSPISYDGYHWSPAGHQRVAALLKELLVTGTARDN
jgi:hypothetical protein